VVAGAWEMSRTAVFKYIEAGDQYCGRCLTVNPVLSVHLAASPPFFDFEDQHTAEEEYLKQTCILQFGQLFDVTGSSKLLRMCVTSIVYHREWFDVHLYHNHVLFQTSTVLRNVVFIDRMSPLIRVSYPWNDMDRTFSGVPPHTSLLQELQSIKVDQRDLITNFVTKVKIALEDVGLDVDRISMEQRIKTLLTDFAEKMDNLYGKGGNGNNNTAATDEDISEDTPETGQYKWRDCFLIFGFFLHALLPLVLYDRYLYLGTMHGVPREWEFPRCGLRDFWRQWWIGDGRRQIPPLRFIDLEDVRHIDKKPISDQESHGRRGNNKGKRRKAVKILLDMNFIIKYIKHKLEKKGMWFKRHEPITQQKVNNMFAEVNDDFMVNRRDVQKSWITVVRQVQKDNKKAKVVLPFDDNNNSDSDSSDSDLE
jgi:hypothetical protein